MTITVKAETYRCWCLAVELDKHGAMYTWQAVGKFGGRYFYSRTEAQRTGRSGHYHTPQTALAAAKAWVRRNGDRIS